jgi:hypothetical protein
MKDMDIIVAPDGTDCFTNGGSWRSVSFGLIVALMAMMWHFSQ